MPVTPVGQKPATNAVDVSAEVRTSKKDGSTYVRLVNNKTGKKYRLVTITERGLQIRARNQGCGLPTDSAGKVLLVA